MGCEKGFYLGLFILFVIISNSFFVLANNYISDVYFTVPNTVYMTGERIELKGFLNQTIYDHNGTFASSLLLTNASVNITIINKNTDALVSSTNFTTDSSGSFYSKSNYYTSADEILAPSTAGNYYIKASYIDPDNNIIFSDVEISVVNESIDSLRVSSQKINYNPSENIQVEVESIKMIGDRILYVANSSVTGSLRDANKEIVSGSTFSCVTGSDGKCTANITAPSIYGDYVLEVENFKAFGSLYIVPFSFSTYVKDDLGKSLKNVFSKGDQARIEVDINNASDSDVYTFSGYIDTNKTEGVNATEIDSTTLSSSNSFTNSFAFTIDPTKFSYGTYTAYLTVSKSGDGSIQSSVSFTIQDWTLGINKKPINSGFEYEYSTFLNKTISFEAVPSYRSNGSVIQNISNSSFTINLVDNLNNILANATANWNSSCESSGCYEFSLVSPNNIGVYALQTTLFYEGDSQTETQVINVINGVLSADSTDKDGNIKELFGTNEYVYISLSSYNSTTSQINLSDAEIFLVNYMDGSSVSYTQVSNFNLVNMSNSENEWAWNSSLQRLKLDVPRAGGVYDVYIFGNNRSIGTYSKFIVNPYDACSAAKSTADSTGGYYVWQFQTRDTVYFEIKLSQANNPLGRATASNLSTNSTTSNSGGNSSGGGGGGGGTIGMGAACSSDNTKQAVSNATLSVDDITNLESGVVQNINASASVCQETTSGTYLCTIKPLSSWDGGNNIVKINIAGKDGATSVMYTRFEARAFYLYGYSPNYQNNPSNNITLQLYMYEAGSGWWTSGTGLTGSQVSVKKVEYQGRDGEWLPVPVDSGYNVSVLNISTISSGGSGNITLPVSNMPGGVWKTGYYRVLLQGRKASTGETDYGYAWFSVRLWDVYGQPIECTSSSCNYKDYFNSRDNITMYVKISKAGTWDNGGQDIYGNVSIGIKSIQNCKTWPCKTLNASEYSASSINVNASSPWYWSSNANSSSTTNYIIHINSTTGTWGTGYYSVVLDVNGSDTGNAWFNTIAFYIDTQPTNSDGSYKYSIRNGPMYFNITTTKNYKWNYNGGIRYNSSDYVNTTFSSLVLRSWDQTNNKNIELNYPTDLNITPLTINGTQMINVTYKNGNWPSGYYWGELSLKNSDNETSSGYLWFSVYPFRIQTNTLNNQYDFDTEDCVNTSLSIYDPDWNTNSLIYGNYSITSIYEDIWSGFGNSRTTYTNYSSNIFNASSFLYLCPNSGGWGSANHGGYHYINIIVKNENNDTQSGYLYFRTVPFTLSWGSVSDVYYKNSINVVATVKKPNSQTGTSGRLTRLYQWRSDGGMNSNEDYVFRVGSCYSNVTDSCVVSDGDTVTVFAPSGGWRKGYNYIQSELEKTNDASASIYASNSISFNGKDVYSGNFDNYDSTSYYGSGNYKSDFANNTNITIRLRVVDTNNNPANVNITKVQYWYYPPSGASCWSDDCRTYTDVIYSPNIATGGVGVLNIKVPDSGWELGYYYFRANVSGIAGSSIISDGNVRVKDFTPPIITLNSPINNQTYNGSVGLGATTNKNSWCTISIYNYNNFYWNYCYNWDSVNSSSQTKNACNTTKYGYVGNTYYYDYYSNGYHYRYNGSVSTNDYTTYLITGGTEQSFTVDFSDYLDQTYGLYFSCYDQDNNYAYALVTFRVNNTIPINPNNITVSLVSPSNQSYFNNRTVWLAADFSNNVTLKNATLYIWNSSGIVNNNISVNLGGMSNSTNQTVTFPRDGIYRWNYYVCDNSSSCKFNSTNYSIYIATVAPNVILTFPGNNTYTRNNLTTFYFDGVVYYSGGSSYVLHVWNSSGYDFFTSTGGGSSSGDPPVNFSPSAEPAMELVRDGVYLWNFLIGDLAGNYAFAPANYTITLDRINPSLVINSPANNSNLTSRTISLNLNVSDTYLNYTGVYVYNSTSNFSVLVNSTTSTNSGNFNISLTVPAAGLFKVNVSSLDYARNINLSQIFVNVTV